MGADTESLLSMAVTLDRVAAQLREIAAHTLAEAQSGWQSAAADRFRERLGEGTAAVGTCAAHLEAAAAAVRLHALRCADAARAAADAAGPSR